MSFLPAISVSALIVAGSVWAAMHDLARAGVDTRLEWAALAAAATAFVMLCRSARKALAANERAAWRAATSLLVLLFDLGAISAVPRPKFAGDPLTGTVFSRQVCQRS